MVVAMGRLRFSLTSDQLELLLAFENSQGLNHLSEMMARDPSVISRNLQKIAEESPVLKKVRGRWELTPLGVQMNEQTRLYLEKQIALLSPNSSVERTKISTLANDDSILIIINAQNGLLDATHEGRNNSEAEKNISLLLEHWRKRKRRVVHVKHISENPSSIFYKQNLSSDFLKPLYPTSNETVVEKTKSSAFTNTGLEEQLNKNGCSDIILAGFTANECIDATARDASAKGFTTLVVGDACATFDLRDPSGKLVKAERIHRLTLMNINAFYAKVVETKELL